MKKLYMKAAKTVLFFLAGLLLSGCIDEVQLDIEGGKQLVAVDGLITDSLQVHTITLTYSNLLSVKGAGTDTYVTGATVKVFDDAGNSYEFAEEGSGKYTKLMQGEVGRAYHLEAVLSSGKRIQSSSTVLTKAPPMSAPNYVVNEVQTIGNTGQNIYNKWLVLNLNTDLTGLPERPYLRWRATGEYELAEDYPGIFNGKVCYAKNNIDFNVVKVYDTHKLEDGQLTNEPYINMQYDYRFYIMYCFHLQQYSISEAEYEYLKAVNDIVNIDGSLFDPPPGTVKGNLYNPDDANDQILGYFSVAGVTSGRYFVNSTDLRTSVVALCAGWPPPNRHPECYDCLVLPFSTNQRPAYWKP
ncbi:MAG: DUF4249 domain-containing protein [Saprospiraceae bacterium]|nr:DUF4249 domain-containing protein [Saprospiraceae bacterium]